MNLKFTEATGHSRRAIPSIILDTKAQITTGKRLPISSGEPVVPHTDAYINLSATFYSRTSATSPSASRAIPGNFEINLYSLSDRLNDFKKEQRVFYAMREQLQREYPGKYVAIYKERVVDSDVNESVLIGRFYKTYGNVPVYIDRTEKIKRVPKVFSPRKAR